MNSFKISQKGIELIKDFEGCYTTAYWDKYGKVYTIGYGHTGNDVHKKKTITKKEAEDLLRRDLERFEKFVNNPSYVPHKLNQNQFDALVSFSFNCGQGNLKKLVKNRNLSEIANELTEYNKSGGKVLNGLIRRREAEKKLFLTGEFTSPTLPPSYQPTKTGNILKTEIGHFTFHMDTILEKTKDEFNFLIGDYNHNGSLDLYCIKSFGGSENFTEVHILNGANNFKSWLLQIPTKLKEEEADWDFCLGDYNHDGYLDLFCIKKNKTGTNSTEVHILGGESNFQTFLLQTGTALHETGNNCKFCVGDYNNDGKLDLFYICKNNTGSKSTEVHILSGKSGYKEFIMQTGTKIQETDDNWEFGISNYLGNGNKDLYCINKRNENGKCTDVHILDGSKNFQSFALQTTTKLHMTDENFCFYPVDKQLFVISKQGASNFTECHALRV